MVCEYRYMRVLSDLYESSGVQSLNDSETRAMAKAFKSLRLNKKSLLRELMWSATIEKRKWEDIVQLAETIRQNRAVLRKRKVFSSIKTPESAPLPVSLYEEILKKVNDALSKEKIERDIRNEYGKSGSFLMRHFRDEVCELKKSKSDLFADFMREVEETLKKARGKEKRIRAIQEILERFKRLDSGINLA